MAKVFSVEELDEVKQTIKKILKHVEFYLKTTANNDEWYAGITGQDQIDEIKEELILEEVSSKEVLNEIAKRINGHKANFPNMDVKSWCEWKTSCKEVALEIETQLHDMEFEGGGGKGNLSLNPTIVYVFRHGKKS